METLKINVDTTEVKEAAAALEALAVAAERARKALDALEKRPVSVSADDPLYVDLMDGTRIYATSKPV